ncbi:hypothetical protein AYI68_g1416 [Smittium mucronatum]|uniref:Uncharacterized protein n=1 Tax=Smittium mucronatum TaxID=133383 RepID=A0A1R0H5M6_9FUNG|nr:hypothetical protein AYI68_g1416 [Smittium mucronatum]
MMKDTSKDKIYYSTIPKYDYEKAVLDSEYHFKDVLETETNLVYAYFRIILFLEWENFEALKNMGSKNQLPSYRDIICSCREIIKGWKWPHMYL